MPPDDPEVLRRLERAIREMEAPDGNEVNRVNVGHDELELVCWCTVPNFAIDFACFLFLPHFFCHLFIFVPIWVFSNYSI